MNELQQIKSLTFDDIENIIASLNTDKYRANQIWNELYLSKCDSFENMKTLPIKIREKLAESYTFDVFTKYKKQISIDGSVKFLFTLNDGKMIEAVYMPWIDGDEDIPTRTTLCISSQVGCAVDCQFCATGKLGFSRNLTAAEIVEQVMFVEKDLGVKITNIVFMGMGEPLLNYNNVMKAISIFTNPLAQFMSRKKITISTSGIVPKIMKMAEEKVLVKLAISLHATTNGVREKIVPWNKRGNISSIMDAVENYYKASKLRITYEYIPFEGLNDTDSDAKRLAKILKRVPSRLNIIPFNDISFTNPTGYAAELKPTPKDKILDFAERIRYYGGVVIVRDTFGQDIDAACGQLALSERN